MTKLSSGEQEDRKFTIGFILACKLDVIMNVVVVRILKHNFDEFFF